MPSIGRPPDVAPGFLTALDVMLHAVAAHRTVATRPCCLDFRPSTKARPTIWPRGVSSVSRSPRQAPDRSQTSCARWSRSGTVRSVDRYLLDHPWRRWTSFGRAGGHPIPAELVGQGRIGARRHGRNPPDPAGADREARCGAEFPSGPLGRFSNVCRFVGASRTRFNNCGRIRSASRWHLACSLCSGLEVRLPSSFHSPESGSSWCRTGAITSIRLWAAGLHGTRRRPLRSESLRVATVALGSDKCFEEVQEREMPPRATG
jgi:hypothetical protein